MRNATVERRTSETDIKLSLYLNSNETSEIDTGIGFFDHMLYSFAKHGRMKLNVKCNGDLHVDDHHTVEDIGICLGLALKKALGDKKGVSRYGFSSVPMDETLCQCTIDLSGRFYFKYHGVKPTGYLKDYNLEMNQEFLYAFASNAGMNLHVDVKYGENTHHITEAVYKSVARALYEACKIDKDLNDIVMSTKGSI